MSDLREKLMNLTVAETVSYSVTALMVLIGVVSLIVTAVKTGSYRDKLFMMESQRTQLKGQLEQDVGADMDGGKEAAAEPAVDEEGNPLPDDGTADIIISGKGSAQNAGVSVANFQNRYIRALLDRAGGELDSDKTARSDAYDMLLPYFSEGYESSAESWFDPSSRYQSGTGNNFVWEFNSKFSFEGSQLPVIWTCRHQRGKGPDNMDAANEIVAYTTGIYDLNTGKFSGLETHVTGVGKPMTVGYAAPQETVNPPEHNDEENGANMLADEGSGTETQGSVSGNGLEQDGNSVDLWGEEDDSEILEVEDENESSGEQVLDDDDNGGLPDNFFQQ